MLMNSNKSLHRVYKYFFLPLYKLCGVKVCLLFVFWLESCYFDKHLVTVTRSAMSVLKMISIGLSGQIDKDSVQNILTRKNYKAF